MIIISDSQRQSASVGVNEKYRSSKVFLIKVCYRYLEEVSLAKRHCGKRDIYRHVINRSNFVVTFKIRSFSTSTGQSRTGPFKLIWQCGQGKEKFIHGVPSIIPKDTTRKDLDIFRGLTSEKVSKYNFLTIYRKIKLIMHM